ncbi:MAG: endonuclease III, partial [candidate division Zixibacteria bacterium]|nr:endonuclease III [Candidatus Saccharibacteria bacterium]NIR63692.1 endonuclease III [candidate division Zixibacteria bacterium]NIS14736.1 endonuclease III [candidate division Zixibacteria bacterium]NIS45648.1 endonuclease III [candidate division Zixibacteria bacterium]NIU13776.1 endonuclease III [candidate division Zixibacteria bacterium]
MDKKDRARKAVSLLKKEYPDSRCTLDFKNPHQLVVATILSAQSTDERVNMITPMLFKKYRSPEDFAEANLEELQEYIKTAGLYRNKSKSIKNCMKMVVEQYGGKIPKTMEELVKLPGVGRKTANVILGAAYNIASGIAVDTHVIRLSKLLKLTNEKDAPKIEKDLMELVPENDWIIVSHLLIDHGRKVCIA